MIQLQNISKKFKSDFWQKPNIILDQINLSIKPSVVTGFLGSNGAGKTTLIKIMMGFIAADEGKVVFSPQLGANELKAKENIGYLPERPYFYQQLTGREFLNYLGQLQDIPSTQLSQKIHYWSEMFKIEVALNKKLQFYSKGMLQRIGLVSCLIHDPQLIILDEPLSGLDPIGRKEIKDIIFHLNHHLNKTIFFSSHIMSDVEELCQQVVFLEKGKIIYDGDVSSLIKNHQKNSLISYELKIKFKEEINTLQTPVLGYKKVEQENLYLIKVKKEYKDQLIRESLHLNGEIESVQQEKISLDEIFYKI